jgi:transformation/transcription domain-associated protein
MTPVGIEGLFTSCLMATARSLTDHELELDQYLCLFIRDELITWHMNNHRPVTDVQFHERIQANVQQIITKAQLMSCRNETEEVVSGRRPVSQNIIDLVSQASNPQRMAQMECTWMSWL